MKIIQNIRRYMSIKFLIFLLIITVGPVLLFLWLMFGDHSTVYEFSQPFENITSVKIVNVESDWDVYNQNFDSIEVIANIEYDMIQEFYDNFTSLQCERTGMDSIMGFDYEAFMIKYSDGSCEVVDIYGGYHYDAVKDKGGYKYYYFEKEPFDELIEKYIALSE